MARPDWYDENRYRGFPFLSGLTGHAVSGPLTLKNLPLATIVDFGCIMGFDSQFEPASDSVFLYSVMRSGSLFTFEFRSSSPLLFGIVLRFTRQLTDLPLTVEYSDSAEIPQSIVSNTSLTNECPVEPAWSGWLVTGDLTALAAILLSGHSLTGPVGNYAQTEPSTTINQSNHMALSVNLANDDRTRATTPTGCADLVWPYPVGSTIVQQTCLQGVLTIMAGFNVVITQNDFENTLELSAEPGTGVVGNCGDLALYPNETPPVGTTTLDGSISCDQVLTSINGVTGSQLDFQGGAGVTVTSVPASNTIIINVNMNDVGNVCERFDGGAVSISEGGGSTGGSSHGSSNSSSANSISETHSPSSSSGMFVAADEVQQLQFHYGGNNPQDTQTYRLELDGHVTALIQANAVAAVVQAAITALPNVGTGNCRIFSASNGAPGASDSWGGFIHFTGALAGTPVSQLNVLEWSGAGSWTTAVIQHGGALSSDDMQFVDDAAGNDSFIVGETFRVLYRGYITPSISPLYSSAPDPAVRLQTALEALPSIGAGNCHVYGQRLDVGVTYCHGFLIRLTGALANTRGHSFTAIKSTGGPPFAVPVTRVSEGF